MRPTHFEDNAISILSFAVNSQATWVAATTISKGCGMAYSLVWWYLTEDHILAPVAERYHFSYLIRSKRNPNHGRTYSISVVSRGYAQA